MSWYSEKSNNNIMVSTRIRIARNIKKYPFPYMMSEDVNKKVAEDIESAILSSNSVISKDFKAIDLNAIDEKQRKTLIEEHLISPILSANKGGRVILDKDKTMSLMINEEDHLRLQVILPGLRLKEAWDLADKIDNLIEESVEYAFDEKLGYLTSCPTNLGTGLRASVMMHLPVLAMTGDISKIIASASSLGIAIRGIYGEGSEALGNLYQISNQITMGYTEEELVEKVENIAKQIEAYEKEAREKVYQKNKDEIDDKVWRSYGILKYARKISSKEAKKLISDVILGNALGVIENNGNNSYYELIVRTEPGMIMSEESLDADKRDIKRAELIRDAI